LPGKISGWATNNGSNLNALKYTPDGKVDTTFLNAVIEQVMFTNGVKMVARFLKNRPADWQENGV
jgi:hypothetical protein